MPTPLDTLTKKGAILGTLQYMAPEQLEGKEADARTDIFAFGAVLYEMVTGKKAFEGKSQASLIAAIMDRDPPPMTTLQPSTPPALNHVVKGCLAKDPDDRWQTARDLWRELMWIAEGGSQAGIPAPPAGWQGGRERLGWTVAAVATLALLAALVPTTLYFRGTPADDRPTWLTVPPPENATLSSQTDPSISPDGRHLAFVADSSGRRLLWLRPMDSPTAQSLPGTEGAFGPFWSPDSRFIGFFAQGKLKKIALSGGLPESLCLECGGVGTSPRGGAWSKEGTILFSPGRGPVYRISATGGEATPVTALDSSRQEDSHRWPYFLPDGRHFLYLARSGQPENIGIYVGSLASTERKRLLNALSNVAYTPPGYLLFLREGRLLAQRFDVTKLQVTGEPIVLVEHVQYNIGSAGASFSVSNNGVLSYRGAGTTGSAAIPSLVQWFDRVGKQLGFIVWQGYAAPDLSPSEKQIAVTRADPQTGTSDIWLLEVAREISRRFTFHPLYDQNPIWSPDGSRIAFSSQRDGPPNLYQKVVAGTGTDERLLKSDKTNRARDWSPDGRFIIYESVDPRTKVDLWVLPLFGDRKAFPFLQTEFNESQGQFSPDGQWIAYSSDESGRSEVYVQSFPSSGSKFRISTTGGSMPRWRGDGKELFYIALDQNLMAVTVKGGSQLEFGSPTALFETRVRTTVPGEENHGYDTTFDGQRFIVVMQPEEAASPITVVLNWTAALGSEGRKR